MLDADDVESALGRAAHLAGKATRYPGMSYEEGLRDALEFVLEITEEDPTE